MSELEANTDLLSTRRRVFEMVGDRKTFAQIGLELGISRQAAYAAWQRACTDYPLPDIETFRRRQLAEIQVAKQALLDVMARDHVSVNAQGVVQREVPDPFGGEPVMVTVLDDEPIIKATTALVRFLERESKLIGGDAPIQVETKNAHVHFTIEGIDPQMLR